MQTTALTWIYLYQYQTVPYLRRNNVRVHLSLVVVNESQRKLSSIYWSTVSVHVVGVQSSIPCLLGTSLDEFSAEVGLSHCVEGTVIGRVVAALGLDLLPLSIEVFIVCIVRNINVSSISP